MKHFVTHPDFPDLKYYPESGNFRWRTNKRGPAKEGAIAGNKRKNGYVMIGCCGTYHLAHRLAYLFMMGKWPEKDIDHDNRIRHDNKWSNLKTSTPTQNNRNRTLWEKNKSGKFGIRWHPRNKRWEASICNVYIGNFKNKEDAIAAREKAEKEYNFHPNHGRRLTGDK